MQTCCRFDLIWFDCRSPSDWWVVVRFFFFLFIVCTKKMGVLFLVVTGDCLCFCLYGEDLGFFFFLSAILLVKFCNWDPLQTKISFIGFYVSWFLCSSLSICLSVWFNSFGCLCVVSKDAIWINGWKAAFFAIVCTTFNTTFFLLLIWISLAHRGMDVFYVSHE